MAVITVRNLSDETHRALKIRAATNGRSTEAEVRSILEEAACPPERVKLGSLLSTIGHKAGIRDEDLGVFERDASVPTPLAFK